MIVLSPVKANSLLHVLGKFIQESQVEEALVQCVQPESQERPLPILVPTASSNARPESFPAMNSSRSTLIHIPTTCDLRSLYGTHLADPSGGRLDLPNSSDLIAGVPWDTDVVTALKGELDVADL
jgi:hypothetical protein